MCAIDAHGARALLGGLGSLERIVLEEHDLVLAPRLRRHHRRLGAGDQLARVHRVLRPLRDPDRDRHLPGRIEIDLLEELGQTVGETQRRGLVARGEDHRELLAAEPADDVGAAHGLRQLARERTEHLVAGAVPVHVVDALEVVDVEHQHRDGVVNAAGTAQLGAQALVEVAMVVEAGERVCLRLMLEPRAHVRVVEGERGRVPEALGELEFLVVEGRIALPVQVQRALQVGSRDERDREHRLGLVHRRARHDLHPRVEMRLVDEHRLTVLRGPARDSLAEVQRVPEQLLGPRVAREHRQEQPPRLVGRVDRERVVRDQILERVRDPLEQRIEALLGKDVVVDVRQAPVRLDEPVEARRIGRRVGRHEVNGLGRQVAGASVQSAIHRQGSPAGAPEAR